MQISEVEEAKRSEEDDSFYIITVAKHKTMLSFGPDKVVVEKEDFDLFQSFAKDEVSKKYQDWTTRIFW